MSALLCLFSTPVWGSVTSETGTINFDISDDGTPEATLNATGFGIATSSPSANLHVNGNAIITEQLSVGSSTTSSDNLYVNGSMASSHQTVSSNTNLGNHSYIFAGNSSTNITLSLPDPTQLSGRVYHVKKIVSGGEVYVTGHGNVIDSSSEKVLISGKLGHLKLISNGSKWMALSAADMNDVLFSDNLFFWMPMEESSTDSIVGLSGNGYTITRSNFGTSGNGWVAGAIGTALQFDGSDDFAMCHATAELQPKGNMTISMWLKCPVLPTTASKTYYLFTKYNLNDNNYSYQVNMPHSGAYADHLRVYLRQNSDNAAKHSRTDATLSANLWYHVVATLSDKIRLYINGTKQSWEQTITLPVRSTDGNLVICTNRAQSPSQRYSAVFDDIRMYDKALSDAEAKLLYQLGAQ
jgi:hypothetical protein